jgi:hypothetical protein
MPEFQLSELLIEGYRLASITAYNRLEASPRTVDFDRSLAAEVRDPLWMLTRQWQFGEFQGEDAATAVTTQIEAGHTLIDRMEFGGDNVAAYKADVPLETVVEQETLRPDLFLAIQLGRYFVKLMKNSGLPAFVQDLQLLLDRYPLNYLPDENDSEGKQLLFSTQGKIFDGFLLYLDIVTPEAGSTVFVNWVENNAVPDAGPLIGLSGVFLNWYRRNFVQPEDKTRFAWQPPKLEYQFTVSSPPIADHQSTLVAERYHEGYLDWYSFDLYRDKMVSDPAGADPGTGDTPELKSYIPSPVTFKGMPHPRFWMMEESRTDFGKIDTSPTGLLHLLLAEFGLTYSNDWFMLPYELSINTLCEIKKIIVRDVFGQYTLILPSGHARENQWEQWSMFTHTDLSADPSASNLFYLAPAITKVQEGEPLEQVNFLRDEMANMVWAVEDTVPSQAGRGVSGKEMALRHEAETPFAATPGVKIRYVLGTTVPDNWIPFIPVHRDASTSEIQLQRAALPGSKGALGVIVTEKSAPYYINEEVIERSGAIVKRGFQRTRWVNGETYVWIGRRKGPGRGEGWSNLKFDQIENIS